MEGRERERFAGGAGHVGGTPGHHTLSKFDLLDRRYYEGAPALFVSTLDIILLLNMLLDCHYICLRCLNYIIFLSHFKVDPHSLP